MHPEWWFEDVGMSLPQSCVIRDRLARRYVDVERNRLHALQPDFDPMRAGLQVQVLCRAVEVVDDADVVAVDEDLRVLRRAFDAHAAIRVPGLRAHVAGWRQRI